METFNLFMQIYFSIISFNVITVNTFDNDEYNNDYLRRFYFASLEDETKLITTQTTTTTGQTRVRRFKKDFEKAKTLSLEQLQAVKNALKEILQGRLDIYIDTRMASNPTTYTNNLHTTESSQYTTVSSQYTADSSQYTTESSQYTTESSQYTDQTSFDIEDDAKRFVRKFENLRDPSRSVSRNNKRTKDFRVTTGILWFQNIEDRRKIFKADKKGVKTLSIEKDDILSTNAAENNFPLTLQSSETFSPHEAKIVSRSSHVRRIGKLKLMKKYVIKPTQTHGRRRNSKSKNKKNKPTHTAKRKNTKIKWTLKTIITKRKWVHRTNKSLYKLTYNLDDENIILRQDPTTTTTTTTPATTTTITPTTTTPAPTTTTTPTTTTPTPTTTTTPTSTTVTTTTPLDYGTTDNRTFDFETPSTIITRTVTRTLTKKFDIPALLDIIANLTYDYETNLTHFVNLTLQKWSIPTCPTPTTVTTTTPTTTTVGYDYWSNGTGTIMGKCFVCGLEEEGIPYHGYCGDAFAGDFIPLTPVDASARGQISNMRKYCRYLDIVGSYLNESDPKSLWGRWTGGCGVRWMDLSGIYTQRTCRNRNRAMLSKHFVSKRMMKLEMALQHLEDGCVISPVASLVPMSRGINLYARFHACVCSKSWCNLATMSSPSIISIIFVTLYHLRSVPFIS